MAFFIRRYIFIGLIPAIIFFFASYAFPSLIFAASSPPGLGQIHWIGGPLTQFEGLKWGYSSIIPFQFGPGEGDHWAAVEQTKGQYNFSQMRENVDLVKSQGKKIWLQLQVADDTTKEHNIPKWALTEGLEIYSPFCGDQNNPGSFVSYRWADVSSSVNNPLYADTGQMQRYTQDGVEMVKFPLYLPAVWDPKFQDGYLKALKALKSYFQTDIDNGTISGFILFSGGHYGEHIIDVKCPGWPGVDCTPDVLNAGCPVIASLAKIKNKQPGEITQKSSCNPANTIPGNVVEICSGSSCPTEYGSFCYTADDYLIQSVKQLVAKEAEIFDDVPLIWQSGPGLSGTGRTAKVLENWMMDTYGSRIYLKANNWNPHDQYFYTSNFQRFGNTTFHGYEVGVPWFFSRSYWNNNQGAVTWCTNSAGSPKPVECSRNPLVPDEIAKIAIAKAVQKGIVEDGSAFLGVQSDFFTSPVSDRGGGKYSNEYYFNPDDNTPDCRNSEINTSSYSIGFCPGYLNKIFSQAGSVRPSPLLTPPLLTPSPTGTNPAGCTYCPAGVLPKNQGNANCDNLIDETDYQLWKNVYIKINTQQPVTEQEVMAVNFHCNPTLPDKNVNLVDFEIWRRNALHSISAITPTGTPIPAGATATPNIDPTTTASDKGTIKGEIQLNKTAPGDHVFVILLNEDGGYVEHKLASKTNENKYSYIIDRDYLNRPLTKQKYIMSAVVYISDSANGGLWEHINTPESCKEHGWSYECVASNVITSGFIQNFNIEIPNGSATLSGMLNIANPGNKTLNYLLVYLCDPPGSIDRCLSKYFLVKIGGFDEMMTQRPSGGNYILPFAQNGKTYSVYAYAQTQDWKGYGNPASDCQNPVSSASLQLCTVTAPKTNQNFNIAISP